MRYLAAPVCALLLALPMTAPASDIIRDAEYRILESKHAERWAQDDHRGSRCVR